MDEVLPPRFLAEAVPHLEPDSLGLAVVQETGGWVGAGQQGRGRRGASIEVLTGC